SKSDLVFGVKEIWHWLKRAADAAGIKGLTVHHLRHTAASRMLTAGVNVKVVQEILGHSSLERTLRYLHTDSTAKRDAIAKLSQIYLATSQKLANEVKQKAQTIEYKPFKIKEN
ncbi:MAG: tyrosine-type recombinase/integrase, partial [Candidatus Aminicenantes bacterium]|nr:tyrosine-type recombinase/integrase [Candidatus Aminicenantes bacterium]